MPRKKTAWDVVWDSVTKSWARVALLITMLTTTATGAAAWSTWGLPVPATRAWTIWHVSDLRDVAVSTRVDTIKLQLQNLATERTRLEDNKTTFQVKLKDATTPADSKLLLQDRLDNIERDLRKNTSRKNKLLNTCRMISTCDPSDLEDD